MSLGWCPYEVFSAISLLSILLIIHIANDILAIIWYLLQLPWKMRKESFWPCLGCSAWAGAVGIEIDLHKKEHNRKERVERHRMRKEVERV